MKDLLFIMKTALAYHDKHDISPVYHDPLKDQPETGAFL
jgi:hypothetical protein